MADFYDEMADMAAELLSEDRGAGGLGAVGAIRVETRAEDEDSLTPGDPVTTNHSCRYVFDEYKDRQRDGTRIQMTDRMAIIAAKDLAVVPSSAHKFVDVDGEAYEIVTVMPIKPAGTGVIYIAQIRR